MHAKAKLRSIINIEKLHRSLQQFSFGLRTCSFVSAWS